MHVSTTLSPDLYKGATMADDSNGMEFEEIPLEDARRMGRGPRMEPLLYDTLRTKIQALSTEATRIRLGPEIQPARMKNYTHSIGFSGREYYRSSEAA